jgi:hypothetical protein
MCAEPLRSSKREATSILDRPEAFFYDPWAVLLDKGTRDMRDKLLVSGSILILLAATGATAVAQEAAAPGPAVPPALPSEPSGPLISSDVQRVKARLEYWSGRIKSATTPDEVTVAAGGARNDYRVYASQNYRYSFAEQAESVLAPLLAGGLPQDDKLRAVKEVNVAMILARMPQVTVRQALAAMVANPNPAVRYLGWEGFKGIRSLILAQSEEFADDMRNALTTAADKETSAPVVGAIFEMADISPLASEFASKGIPSSRIQTAQRRMYATMRDNWARWCGRVRYADAEMSKAMQKSIAPIETLYAAQAAGDQSKKQALQMLVDLSACAAKAYDFSAGQGPIADENVALLRTCEAGLNEISGKSGNHIGKALTDDQIVDRGAAVREAVFAWVDDLKDEGVVASTIEAPAPDEGGTTVPSSPGAETGS